MKNIELKVTVTGQRTWAVRLWVGMILLKTAALVFGCKITVDVV